MGCESGFYLENAALNDASVDYFAERCGVDFRKEGTAMSYRVLKGWLMMP